jgi:predicted transport protein
MKLFSSTSTNLTQISEKPFKLEKEIQNITEANMELIFNLEFVDSEFSLSNFRIDSLAFDSELNSFVIIEYKNTKNFSVIDQGYSYLSLLLNNKAEFVLRYNELKNKNLKKDSIDWSQSKVIFVSPSYTVYQKESINFKDLPIELWEIKQFVNNTVMYLPIKANKTTESINTITSADNTITAVNQEVKTYTEEEHYLYLPENMRELYDNLKSEILNLGEINIKPTSYYVAFVGKKNVVCITTRKNKLVACINLKFTEIEDYKKQVRDVSKIGHNGTGECEYSLDNIQDLDYLMTLIKQSYAKNG